LDKSQVLLIVVMVLVIAIGLVLQGLIHYFCGNRGKKNEEKESTYPASNNSRCSKMATSSPQFIGYTNAHGPVMDQISTIEKAIFTTSIKI